ncbi:hypothetical protein CW304_04450 [Bacillus sp. UFRGS-B20]|nr:hypothetical protein CW304_04450 [Bacillus sp. UFRGS-B20]
MIKINLNFKGDFFFPEYIGAAQFISAISQLYRATQLFSPGFPIISAQHQFISAISPIISAQLNLIKRFPN